MLKHHWSVCCSGSTSSYQFPIQYHEDDHVIFPSLPTEWLHKSQYGSPYNSVMMEHQSHFLLPFVESFSFLMPSPLWLHNAVRLVNPKNLIIACHSSWLEGCLVKIEGLLHNDLLVWWLVDRGLCLSTLWSHDSLLWQQITTWSLQLSYKAWRALCCYPGWSYLSGNSEEYAVSKKWIRRKKSFHPHHPREN